MLRDEFRSSLDLLRKVAPLRYLAHMTTARDSHGTGIVPQWTVGDRLRKARELVDLDVKQFAVEIGVSRNTIHKYEHLDEPPRTLVLRAWALRTGVNPEWLRTGALPFDEADPVGHPIDDTPGRRNNPCYSHSRVILGPWGPPTNSRVILGPWGPPTNSRVTAA
jgi:DNA-binding XRE family transcriptional regulator